MAAVLVDPIRSLTLTQGGQAQLRFPYDEGVIEELKGRVDGIGWNGILRAWTVRVRAANIRAIVTFAREHGLAGIEAASVVQARLFQAARETIVASRAPDAVFVPPASLRGVLRPFQRAGVAYAVAARRCLLADEMGLGKTVEAIATLESLAAFPAIVTCPAGLKLNWLREFAAWLPGRKAEIADGSSEIGKGGPADVVIVSYDWMTDHVDELRALKPKAVVFDEGHLLKDATTARSKAARKLRVRVPVRLILTGTPVLNTPSELLNLLAILGRLPDLGGFWHFAKQYCGGKEVERIVQGGEKRQGWDLTGASHLTELAGRLRATCMVRRRKRDVLPELPPRHLAMLPVEIDTREEYDLAQKDVLAWVAKRAGKDPVFRAKIAGLDPDEQIAAILARAQDAVERAAAAEELVQIESLRQISARGKMAQAEEWIRNFMATGEKLVVFGWHKEVLAPLAKIFGAPLIDGETPVAKRQAIVDEFQRRNGKLVHPPLFVNLQAGGVGLTLTAASNVLVLELPWTRALLDQAIDRVHRIGQTLPVTAWILMGRRTLDYSIWKLLEKKNRIAQAITN